MADSIISDTCLFYIHDPMCSWCFALSSNLSALQNDLPSNIRMIFLLGGLAPDTTEPMPTDLQKAIQQTWRQIERTVPTTRFNYDFWTENTPLRSTYPACRAILAARKQGAKFESQMLQAIQLAYYQQAKNPSLAITLQQCAAEIGLDENAFINDLTSPAIESELRSEIQLARNMGVTSYPSLRLLHKQKLIAIPIDYLNHQTMIDLVNSY